MDQKRYETGLANRRDVLGAEHVDRALENVGDFDRQFQDLVTEMAWGECWGDPTLPRRERSILNLGMLAALGRMHEFELHFRAALVNNKVPLEELKEVLLQIAVYCGIPAGVEVFRVARKVLAEEGVTK
jgi:4-carboxymuconolactone decarboxylase